MRLSTSSCEPWSTCLPRSNHPAHPTQPPSPPAPQPFSFLWHFLFQWSGRKRVPWRVSLPLPSETRRWKSEGRHLHTVGVALPVENRRLDCALIPTVASLTREDHPMSCVADLGHCSAASGQMLPTSSASNLFLGSPEGDCPLTSVGHVCPVGRVYIKPTWLPAGGILCCAPRGESLLRPSAYAWQGTTFGS